MAAGAMDAIEAAAGGPLAGLRVVELGDGTAGPYAAKLLGDFGAEVVKVESASGDSTRRRGPFADDAPDPEASGLFHYLNTNKLGIVLDLADAQGRATLDRLIARADIFVSNLALEQLAHAGVAPSALRARHPHLIVTSITPFGSDGPWAARRGDELVIYAMGGIAYSTPGMPDAAADLEAEPPLHAACFVAETVAGLAAATATLAAVRNRALGGGGCLVELSQHAAVAAMQQRDITTYSYQTGTYNRLLNPTTIGRMPNFYLPCKDGHVTIAAPMEIHWERLVEAMGKPAWALGPNFAAGDARIENWVDLRRRLTEWTMTLTGAELYALAEERQLPVFPFYPVRKVVESAHAQARDSVIDVEIGARRARMPAAPFKMHDTPWRMRRPAPRLGEHSQQVRRTWLDIAAPPRAAAAPSGAAGAARPLPLAGIRVLDLGQFIAMPFCSLWLGWLGAEVIVVESRRRMTSRTGPPFAPGHAGDLNGSGYFNLLYSGKKSCTIDMTTAAGRDLVRRLAGKVDVMVDNFSTGVLEKLGLSYDVVSPLNPALIAVSCGAFGRSGPLKNARGLHSAVNLFSGVADVTGYPGGAPRILGGVLPDPFSGTYGNFAIQAALIERNRTGRGQFIDLAMYEAMMTLIPEAVIDLTLNGRDPVRIGNRDRVKTPHGIYRCRAADSWVAISVDGQADWAVFCRAAGHAEWQADERFADAVARRANADALDRAVESWTLSLDPDQATRRLQDAGVAAGPVRRCDQLLDDEILLHRGTVISTDHPLAGRRRQLGLPWRMDSVGTDYRRAPLLGEHTQEVLSTLLGIGAQEYAGLDSAGVLA